MVEDVPPYWIYLPRNLSYVGDQVWDYFVCCKRRNTVKMDGLTVDCSELVDKDEGLPGSPKSPDSLDDSGHYEDIFGDLKIKDCDGEVAGNGRSDYGSDVSSPLSLTGYGSDVTITDDDAVPLIISPDEDLLEPEFFPNNKDPFDEIIVTPTPTSPVAELHVNAETTDLHAMTNSVKCDDGLHCNMDNEAAAAGSLEAQKSSGLSGSQLALKMFKDQANNNDEKRLSFLDLLAPESGYFDEKDGDGEFPAPELRRSTSLKTNKTPPGTPRRKKAVRFADAFGLDLEHVRHVLNLDSPPRIPPSAVADLKTGVEKEHVTEGNKYFQGLFPQPGNMGGFVQRVLAQKVCLENAMINNLTITGTVRVANISYHKCVKIRFTVNDWLTFTDVMASYVQNSCDGATDRFSFTVCSPRNVEAGKKLQFAVSFEASGVQYWDNNYGENYVFECYARAMPTLASDNSWLHFL